MATGRRLRDVLRDPEGRWMRWELNQKLDAYTGWEGRGAHSRVSEGLSLSPGSVS